MRADVERNMAANGQGCLGKASSDEPVFILRAKDMFAPLAVELWASMVEGSYSSTVMDHPVRHKIAEARGLARQMREWQAVNGSKRPD